MSLEQILATLAAAGHGAHADAVAALAQPAFRLTATALAPGPSRFRRADDDDPYDAAKLDGFEAALAALPLGASRLGGVPDLAPGVAWPARDGVPMEFIAQVRLADVVEPRLPPAGNLAFFYNSQWTTSERAPGAACCAVVFHDGPDDALVRTAPPRIAWKSEFADVPQVAPFLHGLAAVRFAPTVVVPGGVSPFIGPALAEFWQDFHAEHHAELSGSDGPFHDSFLLGYVDEQDHIDAHGPDDQLLLQVDSEDAAELQFGDCHKLFFVLTKAELAARDFARVRVYSELG